MIQLHTVMPSEKPPRTSISSHLRIFISSHLIPTLRPVPGAPQEAGIHLAGRLRGAGGEPGSWREGKRLKGPTPPGTTQDPSADGIRSMCRNLPTCGGVPSANEQLQLVVVPRQGELHSDLPAVWGRGLGHMCLGKKYEELW